MKFCERVARILNTAARYAVSVLLVAISSGLALAQAGAEGPTSRARGRTRRQCHFSVGGRSAIFQGERQQGAHAHLHRSVQQEQVNQRQWRSEVDREGRRLLRQMQQAVGGNFVWSCAYAG